MDVDHHRCWWDHMKSHCRDGCSIEERCTMLSCIIKKTNKVWLAFMAVAHREAKDKLGKQMIALNTYFVFNSSFKISSHQTLTRVQG